jgi:hypothetical protein
MKKYSITALAVLLLAAGCSSQPVVEVLPKSHPDPIACPVDAKLCADGSYAVRTGPLCQFTACPNEKPGDTKPAPSPAVDSGVEGTVTIGPSCPVLRDPPDPGCADKPYAAELIVQTASDKREVGRTMSTASGKFHIGLAPGKYVLVPVGGRIYPQASPQEFVVAAGVFTKVDIQFDSGIR